MEQLAIIRRPKLGASDRGTVALSFESYIADSAAALQVLWVEANEDDAKRAWQLLGSVRDVAQLEGKPCWVDVDGGMIRYLRPAKAGAK